MPQCFEDDEVCLRDLVTDLCADRRFPVVAGVPSGHGRGLVTLPLGLRVRVAGDEIELLEAAVD
jgi:muramoyltetrapeptide carboxypeptidase LdcA involved in peptidoglycan recycling